MTPVATKIGDSVPMNVALFCSSSPSCPVEYQESAKQLATSVSKHGLGLVYGGGDWGLMGICAKQAAALGVPVTGILPRFMSHDPRSRTTHGELVLVEDMAERKAEISERSAMFVALPGGFGTLDEVTEMITWNQIGYQTKPVGLLNVGGFWDGLLVWVERAMADGLIKPIHWETVFVDEDADRLIARLLAFQPDPNLAKFTTRA